VRKTGATVAWVCALSTLCMACYSSALIEPTERVLSETINYVITTDGSKYVFDSPPSVIGKAIVGMSKNTAVSIPLSEVSRVHVTKYEPVTTTIVVVGIVAALAAAIIVVVAGGVDTPLSR